MPRLDRSSENKISICGRADRPATVARATRVNPANPQTAGENLRESSAAELSRDSQCPEKMEWKKLSLEIEAILQSIDEFTGVPNEIGLRELNALENLKTAKVNKIANYEELHNDLFSTDNLSLDVKDKVLDSIKYKLINGAIRGTMREGNGAWSVHSVSASCSVLCACYVCVINM